MVIFLNLDGTAVAVSPQHVYQGSNNVVNIDVIAHFPPSTALEISFIMPNGLRTEYFPMSYKSVVSGNGEISNVWSYVLPCTITAQAGDLYAAINAVTLSGNTTSFLVKIVIEKSLIPLPPPFPPDQNQWELILQYMQQTFVAADEAENIAKEAINRSNEAITTANDAKTIAQGIEEKVTLALSKSENAESLGLTAIGTANSAQSVANSALTKSVEANETSNNALTNANTAMVEASKANGKADNAFLQSSHALFAVNNVRSPVTGIFGSIQTAIDDLLSYSSYGITAGAFDDLNLSASAYDHKNITALDFDTKSKFILIGGN